MKQILKIMAILMMVAVSCNKKPQDKVELAFQQYVSETFVNTNDFKGIKSIEVKDSMDFYNFISETLETSEETILQRDSIENVFKTTLSNAPQSKVYSNKVQSTLKDIISQTECYKYEIASFKVSVSKLRKFIDSVSDNNRFCRSYKLKVEIKGKPEYVVYYGQEFAFSDSIIFSKEPITKNKMPELMLEASNLVEDVLSTNKYYIDNMELMQRAIFQLQ